MDYLQIPIATDDAIWRQRCNERMERLKNSKLSTSDSPSETREELSEEKKFLSLELYQSVESKNTDRFIDVLEKIISSERNLSLFAVFDQVTIAGDSLLHLAAHFGAKETAELTACHFPELLTRRNIKGDTPLHVAARAKSSNVIELILSQYVAQKSKSLESNDENKKLTRLKNEYGNTALHEAMYSNHYESVSHLFLADKPMAHDLNKSGESPLFIAVTYLNKKIVDLLLEASLPGKPFPQIYGFSPLHAAIFKKDSDLLSDILDKNPELMYLKDEDGETPLHCAASTNYLEGVRVLLNKSTLLALERDKKGNLPIHLACKKGHVDVVKEFIKKGWPNVKDLLNLKGQNILHVAAKKGKENVVKYLLRDAGLQELSINDKDKRGNTALHFASKKSYPEILFLLTQDKRVNVNIKNNDKFTAHDLLLVNQSETQTTFLENLSHVILHQIGAKLSAKATWRHKVISPKMDWIKDRINLITLIAILIATVTFAAGFTVPGGVYSSDENDPQKRGMAVLANKISFQIFMICNTIAMYSSTTGCIILLFASLGDFYLAAKSYHWGSCMVGLALVTMSLAFMAAIRLVVSNVSWLANLITIIANILFFPLILGIYLLFIFPYTCRQYVLRHMSRVIIRIIFLIYHDLNMDKVKPENSGSLQLDLDKDKDMY